MLNEEFITIQIRKEPFNTFVTISKTEKVGFLRQKLGLPNLFFKGIELTNMNSFHHFGIESGDILDTQKIHFSFEDCYLDSIRSDNMKIWMENNRKLMNFKSTAEFFVFLHEEGLLKEHSYYVFGEVKPKTIIPEKPIEPSSEPLPFEPSLDNYYN